MPSTMPLFRANDRRVSSALFAHAVYVGHQKWDLGEASDILVTISEELNIIVPATDSNPAVYIDIPLSSILEVSPEKLYVTDSQQITHESVIQLKDGVTYNCTLNAAGHAERHVKLTFASKKDANTLRRLLTPSNVCFSGIVAPSQSEAIDVSEPVSSDDELAAPGVPLSNNQMLMKTTSLASAIVPYELPVSTIDPSKLELIHASQCISAEHQEGPTSWMAEHKLYQRAGQSVEIAAEGMNGVRNHILVHEAIEGIDVSQTDGPNPDQTHRHYSQPRVSANASSDTRVRRAQDLNDKSHEPMAHFERSSATRLSNSLGWRTGLNDIQDTPDLYVRSPLQKFSSVEQIENERRLEGQDGQYEDLYYASPKVKDNQRRSPKTSARDDNPHQRLELPHESPGRQASIKPGPHIKLSRQLRNAEGVVESHVEQIPDDERTMSRKIHASDVKTGANSKKSRVQAPIPAKSKAVNKESKMPTLKMAQSKGKAIATEELRNTTLDNYDLPPSPLRKDSAIKIPETEKESTASVLKATKAPRSNQRRTKAAATISSKNPATLSKKGFKNNSKANGSIPNSVPNRSSGKKAHSDDEAIWDVDQADSEGNSHDLRRPRQAAKPAKSQEKRVAKIENKNKIQTQMPSDEAKVKKLAKAQIRDPIARLVKAKPAPAALSQPRSRRTAAIKANKRIQGLEESDDIVDDEDFVPPVRRSNRHASSEAAKTPGHQSVRDGGDDRSTPNTKLPKTNPSTEDLIVDSVSPDSCDKQISESLPSPKANSSPEKVDLVRNGPAVALCAAPGDTRASLQKDNPTSAVKNSIMQLPLGHGDRSHQPHQIAEEKVVPVSEARVNMVPDNVPQLKKSIAEIEPIPTRPQQENDEKQGHGHLNAMVSAGTRDQDQLNHVLTYTGDVSFDIISKPNRVDQEVVPPQAPTASMVVGDGQRSASPRLAEAVQKRQIESTTRRRDSFGAKLNAAMPELSYINAKVKSVEASRNVNVKMKGPSTPKIPQIARSAREPKATVLDQLEAKPTEDAKRENPKKYLKSAMQVDGTDEDSQSRILKPASDSKSASRVESKRKFEQASDASHKRVKLTPRERPEGVLKSREATYDAGKTPLPVISKKPLMIEFSSTGPRNQGTVSMRKSKPPEDAGTSAPGAVELRKHDVRDPTINQIEAGFAFVREAPAFPSEEIQHELNSARGDPKIARPILQQKPAECLKNVNPVASCEAVTQEHQFQKRKLAPFVDDPAPWEHEQPSKRLKRDTNTPPNAHNHHPRMLYDFSPAIVHERSQRVSSQNTRVNENGSPMPFIMIRDDDIAPEEQCSEEDDGNDALAEARLEEQIPLQDENAVLLQPLLHLRPLVSAVSAVSMSRPKTMDCQSLSNNSKQVPSSPHAPSAFGTMPPHHVYRDGEIVNAETLESIIPVKLQDPFLGASQDLQNPFMNALRRSTEAAAKRLIAGANNKRERRGVAVRSSLNMGEDPDRTLVEPKVRKRHKKVNISDSSSSSQSSSSTQALQPDESSEDESDADTETKWRRTLEPHQENMLECLLDISHVSDSIS